MSWLCPTHRLATAPDDRDWCLQVARNWKNMDFAIEYWHCPRCDFRNMTVMYKGSRLGYPADLDQEVIIIDEHDNEDNSAQVSGLCPTEVQAM